MLPRLLGAADAVATFPVLRRRDLESEIRWTSSANYETKNKVHAFLHIIHIIEHSNCGHSLSYPLLRLLVVVVVEARVYQSPARIELPPKSIICVQYILSASLTHAPAAARYLLAQGERRAGKR